MTDKTCIVCGETKSIDSFYRASVNRDGYKNECKACKCADSRKRRQENPQYGKEYARKWYLANKEKIMAQSKEWIRNNKERWSEYKKKANAKQTGTVKGRLGNRMSCAIRKSMESGSKSRIHWENIVGYTADDLRVHLEKQFTPEMSWENYGSYWWIDHKTPISAFNYELPTDIDFKKCWSLSNLQPLEKIENMRKNNKVSEPFQPALAIPAIEWMRGRELK